jgi:hypothetical protein
MTFGHVAVAVRNLVSGKTAEHLLPRGVARLPHKPQRIETGDAS